MTSESDAINERMRQSYNAETQRTRPPSAEEPLVLYEMADGSLVYGEFRWVDGLEWFDDRSDEIRLVKKTYRLVSSEEVVLPDPYPPEDDDA